MRYCWLVIFVLLMGSVFAQNSSKVRELEKRRKAALAEIETTNQLLAETKKSAQNSLNRLNLLSKQILSRKQVISLLNQEIGEIDKQIVSSRRQISLLEKDLEKIKWLTLLLSKLLVQDNHLETLEELAIENRDNFLNAGGQEYHYIPALNLDEAHIDLLEALSLPLVKGWAGTLDGWA